MYSVQVLVLPNSFQMEFSIMIHCGEIDQVAYDIMYRVRGKNLKEVHMYFERGMGYKWVRSYTPKKYYVDQPYLYGEKISRPETIFKLAA